MPAQKGWQSQCIFCAYTSRVWQRSQSLEAQRARVTCLTGWYQSRPFSSNRDLCLESSASRTPSQRPRSTRYHPATTASGTKLIQNRSRGERTRILERGSYSFRPNHDSLDGFKDLVRRRLRVVEEALQEPELLESLELDRDSFRETWRRFEKHMEHVLSVGAGENAANEDISAISALKVLRSTHASTGMEGLDTRLKFAFYGHHAGGLTTAAELENQKALADLRYPSEWFPATRQMRRKIHLHVGPTNSGKTYHALKRLEQAESGVYAGPLRLLAYEVFTRLNAKGKTCALITGDDRRFPEDTQKITMHSCTVEMMPLNVPFKVAVIDEIQMIGSQERGWAWTQAVLGVRAEELHLCGEERTVPIIQQLAAAIGDDIEIHRYKRLSPLKMMRESLDGNFSKLRKGDCVVAFSIMGIHALRKEIEQKTGRKVAIIYGSLPPETRAQQAKLFNDPDNDYDFLVASDAIGMGLNLSIKRVIFESATKNNGVEIVPLQVSEVKQIAGRAGRYRTAAQANQEAQGTASEADSESIALPPPPPQEQTIGLVTTLDKFDYQLVSRAMRSEPDPITSAGLFPPSNVVERFANYFPPGTPFSYILLRLHEISRVHYRFHLCGLREQLIIADVVQPIKGLTTSDRLILCASPANVRFNEDKRLLYSLARCIGEQKGGSLLDIDEFNLEVLDREPSGDRGYLKDLEQLHRGIVLYIWLSYRFSGVFSTRALAFHTKELVEVAIEQCLSKFSFTEERRKKIRAQRRQSMIDALKKELSQAAEKEDQSKRQLGGACQGVGQDELERGEQEEVLEEQEPEEVNEILSDLSFTSTVKSEPVDDKDQYPSPELEILDDMERRKHASSSSREARP